MSQDQTRHLSPQDALSKVKEAESAAGRLVQETRENETAQILKNAQEEARRAREALLNDARKSAQQQKAAAVKNAEAEALKIQQESEAEIEALRSSVEPLKAEAVVKTAEKIAALLRSKPI